MPSTAPTSRASIGGYVSYGCIRMYNQDITDLYARVGYGTTIVVVTQYSPICEGARALGRSPARALCFLRLRVTASPVPRTSRGACRRHSYAQALRQQFRRHVCRSTSCPHRRRRGRHTCRA